MGAQPWSYYVTYEPNVRDALHKLRQRVFESGEYRGSEMNPPTPEDALINMEADGTGSILDIMSVSDTPDFSSVCPLAEEKLVELYGTTQPTHEMIDANMEFYEDIERGQGIYIVVYKDGKPDEYFFAGYSFD
jgi:hypothetical protein